LASVTWPVMVARVVWALSALADPVAKIKRKAPTLYRVLIFDPSFFLGPHERKLTGRIPLVRTIGELLGPGVVSIIYPNVIFRD
jgi:hypothetical protein